MNKKDWSMDDFTAPKSRNVIEETKSIKNQKVKVNKKEQNLKTGRIIVYMTREEEMDIRRQAEKAGISAADFGRYKLGLKKYSSF